MMKLLELCEDVFQYVCRLNRSARKGAPLEPTMVRSDIKALLSKTRSKTAGDPLLAQQYEAVERPLVYFIDFMIEESSLPFAGEWKSNRLQKELYSVNDGDEHFFDLLDETLRDTSRQATERLSVYYTCVGLGFTGFYAGQPEYLRRKMMEMQARLREQVDMDTGKRVVPEAYEHVDTSDLIQPPARSLIGLAVAVVAVIVSILAASVVMYLNESRDMRRAIEQTERVLGGEAGSAG
jgi:type IV/VI secretion system ImpK/VasF family protein